MANSTLYDEAAFIARYGDLAKALRNFEAVRCTTFACAALGVLGSLYLLPREVRLIWRQRFTFTRFLLLLNQIVTLVVLCANIQIFTLDRGTVSTDYDIIGTFDSTRSLRIVPSLHYQDDDACSWWFVFRSWSNNTMLLLITMVVLFRLMALCNRKLFVMAVSVTAIVAQATLSTVFMAKHLSGRNILIKAPIPGPWFKGCFPILSQKQSSAVWFSAMTVQCLAMISAVYITLRTWRANDNYSFLAIAKWNGMFYFMAITSSTVFTKIFFTFTPKSLVLAATPIPMVTYCFFGTLLLLNLLEQENSPLDSQGELSSFISRSEVDGASLNDKGRKDLELGLPSAPASTKMHPSPESEVTASPSPCVTVASRQHPAWHDTEKQPPIETSLSTIVASERVSTNSLYTSQAIAKEERLSRPTLAKLSTKVSHSSLGRRHFSEDSPRTRRIEAFQQQADDWTALDDALEEEYDEDGKRRRPRRTHDRKWRSDEFMIMTPPTIHAAIAPPLRVANNNLGSPRHTLMSSTPAWPFSSNTTTSPSSFSIPPSRTTAPTRTRLSIFLHRRHASQESNPTSVPVEASTAEEKMDISPEPLASGPVSPPTPDSPSQLLYRFNTHQSSQSNAARTRKPLATSERPGSAGSTGVRPRGESDRATICSASTGWAFDNNNIRDAPDFGS
ncbi:hypothetical protein FRB94_009954 [Tulasnella sp. JGI-2019a]|nr:hypothetical protein FRB93_009137 [Tulasnella sp. JGI-2019a]KAG8994319.1 hypothetical protein FRB94_009954 [Tulasnella sp. JGI-2019a]